MKINFLALTVTIVIINGVFGIRRVYLSIKCNLYGPGVDSASNRNEYQEYFLG